MSSSVVVGAIMCETGPNVLPLPKVAFIIVISRLPTLWLINGKLYKAFLTGSAFFKYYVSISTYVSSSTNLRIA